MAARLNVLNGKRQGATFELGRGEHIVGHRQTAHLSIDDPWVSWDHARIFVQGDTFWIEDLGSTNGTYVNCVRVKREQLNHEDIIFFGKTHVIFLAHEGASSKTGSTDGAGSGRRGSSIGQALKNPSQSSGPAIPVPPAEAAPIGMPRNVARPPSRMGAVEPPAATPGTWRGAAPPPSRVAPSRDPFASAGSSSGGAIADPLLAAANDPFTISSSDGESLRPLPEEPEERAERSFADTHHDEERGPASAAPRAPQVDLDDFEIDDDEESGGPSGFDKAPSAAEVSRLLGNRTTDDLDALLGEAAAMTPDPAVARLPNQPPRSQLSEARTQANLPALSPQPSPSSVGRRTDPAAITGRMAAEKPAPVPQATPVPPAPPQTARFAAPPPSAPQPPRPTTTKLQPSSALSPVRDLAPDTVLDEPATEPRPHDAASAAFERAKLEDEVRRLRAALKAASERSPEAVRIAAETLRDQELGRQARRVAELEQELAQKRTEVDDKQRELDVVTEDMIAKEDTIDALREALRDAGVADPTNGVTASGKRRAPRLPAAPKQEESSDELRALEF